MFDIVDVLAVREAVRRQTPLRRRICELLMRGQTQKEVASEMHLNQSSVSRHIVRLREALREMGFEPGGHR